MNFEPDRYQTLLKAIDAERRHDEAFFRTLNESKSLQQKVNSGYVWYPVTILRKNYTIGEYIEVEVIHTKKVESNHKFSEGIAASLFNQQKERVEVKGIVSSVRQNKMRLLFHSNQAEKLEFFDKGLTGVEVIYDDKPYKIMEKAILSLLEPKKEAHRVLRDGVANGKLEQIDIEIGQGAMVASRKDINTSQKEAIQICLRAPYLGIIHGPPGTGKTTTIVALTQALLRSEKRILVCAPSNNAVDLLAGRISAKGISVLRVGNISRIHDDLMPLTIEEKVRNHQDWNHIKKVRVQAQEKDKKAAQFKRNFGDVERNERKDLRREAKDLRKWAIELEDRLIEELVQNCQVIAATLIGTSHRILNHVSFKTVIIDEASQALEAECWNAILKADRVIMAGDHKQLPPTVKSTEALKMGMDTTILDMMTDRIVHSCLLTEQYRMNDKILGFSNQRYYAGRLISNPDVADRTIRNDNLPLVYIDTAGCGFEEVMNAEHRSYANHGEFFIIREHLMANVEKFLGVTIGIISPYAEQVRYIRREIEEDADIKTLDIEVNSIDGFQGQEKDVMYISLVRSNDAGEIGFLKDERRMNVAMTRARKKLVIIGDSATLAQYPLFISLIHHIETEGYYDSAWNYMGY